jgi:hypothetical protein
MKKLTIYFAITNHGFGHATRTASVVAALQTECRDRNIEFKPILATTAPQWLLESYISEPFIYHPVVLDVGVVQSDSLTMDKVKTLEQLQNLYANQTAIIASELEFIKSQQVDLIFGDIPPLAVAIARAAMIPCWLSSNFGWDLIYENWDGFEPIIDRIQELYSQCDRLLRLPFHSPMAGFPNREDIGFTGGTPKYELESLGQELNLSSDRPTVLLTFGGLSLDSIPYENLTRFPDWQFLTFDRHAPDLNNLINLWQKNHCPKISPKISLKISPNIRPVDVMPLCDLLLVKPGYSTLSEACRQEIPTICLTRQGFKEAEYLIEGLENYNHHLIIQPEDFYKSNWGFLRQKLNPPKYLFQEDCSVQVDLIESSCTSEISENLKLIQAKNYPIPIPEKYGELAIAKTILNLDL